MGCNRDAMGRPQRIAAVAIVESVPAISECNI